MPSIESAEVPRAALRVSEACHAPAISRSKLYLELAAGRRRAVKCGRRTLIPATRDQGLAGTGALTTR